MDFYQYEELLIPFLEFQFQFLVLGFVGAVLTVFFLGFFACGIAHGEANEADGVGGGILHLLEQKLGERQYVGLALQNLVLRDASCYLGEVGKLYFQGESAAFELAAGYAGKQLQDGVIELYDDGRGCVYIL